MKGYKGFYPGLICEPDSEHKKQYTENTVYEEDKAECCRSGMHFCKYPLNVFGYYPPVTNRGVSEYAEVEALDEPVTDDEEKYCSKKLKIGARIGIPALVQASVEYIKNNIIETKKESATDDYSAATNAGPAGKIRPVLFGLFLHRRLRGYRPFRNRRRHQPGDGGARTPRHHGRAASLPGRRRIRG